MLPILLACALAAQDDGDSKWGIVEFGDDVFTGLRFRASGGIWRDFEIDHKYFVDGVEIHPEFDASFGAFAVGAAFERFEFELEYFDGSGDGDDFDVDVQGARLSVGRPIFGYDGETFDVFLGATIAAMYLRAEFDFDKDFHDVFFGAFAWLTANLEFSERVEGFLRLEAGQYLGDGPLDARLSLGVQVRF